MRTVPNWVKYGGLIVLGMLIVSTKGHIFVQAGTALESVFQGVFGQKGP
jgi:hypothetical protein